MEQNGGFRITPARAGKTFRNVYGGYITRDHPRSCGKDFGDAAIEERGTGSPPLVRERQDAVDVCQASFRITPARAGKTR